VKLWIIRHAKSSWADPGQSDFERPLNKRGKADGERVAHWLINQTAPATWIWSSDAARAMATAQFVGQGFAAVGAQIVSDQRLYLASPETVMDVLRETPSEVGNVALVAHNPGLTWLVNQLADDSVLENLPTLGIARFDVDAAWHQLNATNTRLEWLMTPRELANKNPND
jgi:phosphohistidine phosphatase